jgi:hypothetical protein
VACLSRLQTLKKQLMEYSCDITAIETETETETELESDADISTDDSVQSPTPLACLL